MSLAYQTMPDPLCGHDLVLLPTVCSLFDCNYFNVDLPVSTCNRLCAYAYLVLTSSSHHSLILIRVAFNEKMSATICWINMMGPAISLYSLAIIMEPTFQQERPISHFQTVHI